jgi:hypothetical protein
LGRDVDKQAFWDPNRDWNRQQTSRQRGILKVDGIGSRHVGREAYKQIRNFSVEREGGRMHGKAGRHENRKAARQALSRGDMQVRRQTETGRQTDRRKEKMLNNNFFYNFATPYSIIY